MDAPIRLIARSLASARVPCITSSFQADGVVLLHMLRPLAPDIPVLFIDTMHHFAETLSYRDEIAARWRLNLVIVRAAQPATGLWRRDCQGCCARHKVEPLFAALQAYDLWFTALRRTQSPSRAAVAEVERVELPSGHVLQKINPLVAWSAEDVAAYAAAHAIPLLPLYERGYTSIGCEPCTSPPADPSNPRSGRWKGEKLECGIHVLQPR